MAREFIFNGESLVRVKGGAHYGSRPIAVLSELGLTSDQIKVTPKFSHIDIRCDDFGPEIPAEVMYHLADVRISMTLIHYDREVLNVCIAESMAGAPLSLGPTIVPFAGTLNPAGTMMGGNLPLFSSGNHYISLNIASPEIHKPWRFPTCYLAQSPVEIPLGTQASMVVLNWRAIPYTHYLSIGDATEELYSSGRVLWDFQEDT